MLGSKDTDTINNSYIYDAYKDLYLSEKEREEKLLQGIQSANGLKARVEKVISCTGDTAATYKLSGISLEYDAIFDEPYATTIGQMYTETTSLPYTKVTSIHYQVLSKKDTTWKIDVNNLSVCSLQGLLLLFLDKRDNFANKNEEFYNPSIKKILVTINGMPHELFAA